MTGARLPKLASLRSRSGRCSSNMTSRLRSGEQLIGLVDAEAWSREKHAAHCGPPATAIES